MEQGPDELREGADERAEDLERLTDKPLDEQGEAPPDSEATEDSEDLDTVDPGL